MNKIVALKIALYVGAGYYVVGAIGHYFGLTIFPWTDRHMYVPYQDSALAVVALVLGYFLVVVGRNPLGNRDMLTAIIISAIVASIFSIAIIWKVDFAALGAPDRKFQTITEGILGLIWSGILIWLYPRDKKL